MNANDERGVDHDTPSGETSKPFTRQASDAPGTSGQPPFLRIRINDYLPPGLNGSQGLMRMHWTKRRRQKDAAMALIRQALGPPPHPTTEHFVRVVMLRRRTAGRPMDQDNAASSFKVLGDSLQALGVFEDDAQVAKLEVLQEIGKAKFTEVTVWEIE